MTIVWFRRDLRVADHPPLAEAAARGDVVCLFVLDDGILGRRHHRAPNRLAFLRAGLAALDAELRARGGSLVVRRGDPQRILPELVGATGADRVHVTREISPLGTARDARVRDALASAGAELAEYDADLLVRPEDLPGPEGAGYRVFTPFYRAWLRAQVIPAPLPAPQALTGPELASDPIDLPDDRPLVPAGPGAAAEVIARFAEGDIHYYKEERDLVADDTTSHLSPYLRFGMCTAGQVGRAIGLPGPLEPDPDAFWRQIAWREFFHHLLARRPEAAVTAMQPQYRGIRWDNDAERIAAWAAGRTGFPIVDAAMRQLVERGWVHNRARMIAASFLVKDLLVDWRIGERIFMQHLIDGDPASNNGGWQWVAGTGTDAAPYFRVLNPHRQAKRFDPEGIYIKRHVAELRRVPVEHIHEPWAMDPEVQRRIGCRIGRDYPLPIVDHIERQRIVLGRYREAAGAAG